MSAEVLVAGAGPVGLFTAALLDAAGIRVEVFERNEGPSTHSKASTMHPRTLEVLSAVGTGDGRVLADLLIERGNRVPSAHFAVLPQRLDYTELDTPFPFVLVVPQAETERLLADHLRWRGVPVHYGRAVTGFREAGGELRVSAGDGTWTARFLVGADGARSLVRQQAGIEFDGVPPTTLGFVADIDLAEPPTPRQVWRTGIGYLSAMPMPGSGWRVFGAEPGDTGLAPEQVRERLAEPFGLDELRAALVRIAGTDFGMRGAGWISRAGDSTRNAARYRAGRVLLAGDAGHVHLPAGGQGLNVGLQDAANLAWKLAAEVRGWAPAHLVDGQASYERERLPVARRLMDNTLAQGALMHTFTPGGEALRRMMSDLIGKGGETAAELTGWLSGLGLHYPRPTGSDPLVGTRAPDLALRDGGLHRALRQDRYLLLDLSTDGAFAGLGSGRVEVCVPRSAFPGRPRLRAVLVRPDGYIASATESDELDLDLARWTAPARTPG